MPSLTCMGLQPHTRHSALLLTAAMMAVTADSLSSITHQQGCTCTCTSIELYRRPANCSQHTGLLPAVYTYVHCACVPAICHCSTVLLHHELEQDMLVNLSMLAGRNHKLALAGRLTWTRTNSNSHCCMLKTATTIPPASLMHICRLPVDC